MLFWFLLVFGGVFGGKGEGISIYSWIIVGRKTGMELKATLQLKNMNCVVGY